MKYALERIWRDVICLDLAERAEGNLDKPWDTVCGPRIEPEIPRMLIILPKHLTNPYER
jgi:hypothetical protein